MNKNPESYPYSFNHPDSPKRMMPENDFHVLGEPMILQKVRDIEIEPHRSISNPQEEFSPSHLKKWSPPPKYSDFDYSNYGRNNLVIVEDSQSESSVKLNRKKCLWGLVIFLMLIAIINAVYWSVSQ